MNGGDKGKIDNALIFHENNFQEPVVIIIIIEESGSVSPNTSFLSGG
jgi:hypothetical protein